MERMHRSVAVARHDDSCAGHPSGEEISRLFELALVSEPEPGAAEDARLLLLEYTWISIEAPMDTPFGHQAIKSLRHDSPHALPFYEDT
jgi:hypothetical protein